MNNEKETLYCVGCGQPVCHSEPGQVLAIACSCGALAPILHKKGTGILDTSGDLFEGGWATPFSLLKASRVGGPMPHLEYYLGFSDHESALKTEITRMLRALGAISYKECPDATCREAFERSRQRYLERLSPEGRKEVEQ